MLLYFWGAWCGPCRFETPTLVELYARYKDRGFEILGIDKGDTEQVLRDYLAENGVTWRQVRQEEDGPLLRLYRVHRYPTSLLLDSNGTVVARGLYGDRYEEEVARLLEVDPRSGGAAAEEARDP